MSAKKTPPPLSNAEAFGAAIARLNASTEELTKSMRLVQTQTYLCAAALTRLVEIIAKEHRINFVDHLAPDVLGIENKLRAYVTNIENMRASFPEGSTLAEDGL